MESLLEHRVSGGDRVENGEMLLESQFAGTNLIILYFIFIFGQNFFLFQVDFKNFAAGTGPINVDDDGDW